LAAVASMAIACAAAACAAQRVPVFAAEGLATRDIESIVVAPMIDERAFPETQLPVANYIAQAAQSALQRKGYRVAADGVQAAPPRLTVSLMAADAAALPALSARYALWVAVERLETDDSDVGLDTRVRLAGVLVDSESKEILWRDRAERESSISGAGLAVVSPSVRTYEAVFTAMHSLLETLPGRGGGSK
jgi:TolB-like protein